MKRRTFVKNSVLGATALTFNPLLSSFNFSKTLKISLAQWSLHRSFNAGKLDAADFAAIAKERYKIDAVEYVNGFYRESATNELFWNQLNERSKQAGVKNLVIINGVTYKSSMASG